jgi:Spy/CpxP family protein refolding chaperone
MAKITQAIIATLVLGAAVFAQQATPPGQQPAAQDRQAGPMMRRIMKRRARMGMLRAFRQLNLSDDQRHQLRTLIQTNRTNTQSQRQQLRQLARQRRQGTLSPEELASAKELRKQMRESRIGLRTQVTGLLTPDQKAKLEEMIKARRAQHGMFGRGIKDPNKPN